MARKNRSVSSAWAKTKKRQSVARLYHNCRKYFYCYIRKEYYVMQCKWVVWGVIKYVFGVNSNVNKLTPLPHTKMFAVRKKTLTGEKNVL